jgi:hypothetical protein
MGAIEALRALMFASNSPSIAGNPPPTTIVEYRATKERANSKPSAQLQQESSVSVRSVKVPAVWLLNSSCVLPGSNTGDKEWAGPNQSTKNLIGARLGFNALLCLPNLTNYL